MQVHVGVAALGLPRGGPVEVPDGQLLRVLGHEVDRLGLGPQALAGAVDPHVRALDLEKKKRNWVGYSSWKNI